MGFLFIEERFSMGGGDNEIEETKAEKAQAEIALKRWQDYQNVFKPFENQYMAEVDKMNSTAQMDRASNLALNPIATTFAKEGEKIQANMNVNGVNPNSGKGVLTRNLMSDAQAGAEVNAVSRTTNAQQDAYVGGLQNITAMGQGQATNAVAGMGDIASRAQSYAADSARDSLTDRNNVRSGVGAIVGAGVAYGMSGDDENGGG
jgi:hypothetical protein